MISSAVMSLAARSGEREGTRRVSDGEGEVCLRLTDLFHVFHRPHPRAPSPPDQHHEESIVIRRDLTDEFAEILGFAEISVDRGKPDVGDLIEAGERLHDNSPTAGLRMSLSPKL